MSGSGNSGRFHVLSEPTAAPGKCGVCGSADTQSRESFLDLGLSFDYYGVLYLCDQCVLDVSHQYGYVTPGEAAALKDRIDALTEENIRLTSRLKASEAYIASVFSVDVSSLSADDDRDDATPDSVDEEGVSDEESDDLAAAKSSDESGSDDLRYPDGSAVGSLSL